MRSLVDRTETIAVADLVGSNAATDWKKMKPEQRLALGPASA